MNGLTVSHLRKCYGDLTAVEDLDLQVKRGEIFGLIGPNGAGKSTSMMMIIGLLKPDSGTISFDDQPYDIHNSEMRSRFGLVPQNLAIYPELTTVQNLRFFGRLNGLSGQKLQERIDYVLHLTGLKDNANHSVATFSGGMMRRLNFGIALVHEPEFVVLDEPTVGIDPQSRSNLLDGVRELSKQGAGVLYASHYMEEVEAICDRVAIMDHGRLLKEGTIDELLDRNQAELSIEVESLPAEVAAKLQGIAEIETDDQGKTRIEVSQTLHRRDDSNRLRSVFEILDRAGIPLESLASQKTSLETLFLKLTGRRLRD
ncbi:MAG: transporter ATP-binding protein [Schlesneria sp.]|nr:transporter ATP-binding protein [Schlesneria sp.]